MKSNKSLQNSFYFIIFLIITNLLLIFSQAATLIRFLKTPQNRIFPFVHTDWAHDYYLYLSVITQGENGSWLYRDPYTTEPTNPGIFYLFFTTIGQTAKIFHLPGVSAYHITTFLGFEFFVILLYLLSSQILGKKPAFWASMMSILGTVSPTLIMNQKIDFPINMPWWIMMDALERLYALPHYVFSQALLLLAIILFIKFFRTAKLRYALSSALSFGIGGFILPSILIPAFVILPLFLFFYSSYHSINLRRISIKPALFLGMLVILIICFADYLIMKLQVQSGFPWDQWTKWGLARWNYNEPGFDKTLLLSFGILPLLSLPAIISGVRKKNWEMIFVAMWAFLPFILLPFATPLEIAKIRLVQMANFVPFGILATYSIFQIIPKYILANLKGTILETDFSRIGNRLNKEGANWPSTNTTKKKVRPEKFVSEGLLILIMLIIFIITTLPVSLNILNQRIQYVKTEPIYDHFYIPKTSFDAIKFINKNIPANSVILAHEKYGIIIPAFVPVVSFFGHVTQTMNYFGKEKDVTNFFSGIWSEKETKQFLITNKISYIYYGWQEEELGFDISKYPFLKEIFRNEDVTFYKVI